jgi:predicted P-loop ATPase
LLSFFADRDYLLEHFDIRYNNVSTEFEYKEKHQEDFKPINENDIFIKMQLDGLNLSLGNLVAFLKSSMVPKHNPFVQYFGSLHPWDGETDYIQQLASFVILKPEVRNRFDTHFKKWLVRVVKCALVDSYFNKQAFILVHDKQNSGKSTFCRFLCPPQLSNYIAENLSIDKDSRILLTTNLLINLDELSTLSKFEINALKSLFSKDKINDRLPYDRKNSIIPRRASFIGSTNQAEFLNDESGSVRWLCFVIESIDWSYMDKVNINDVWSQAYHLFKNNFSCDLNPDEIKENEEYNRQFNITTAEFELIHKYLSPATRENNDCFMTATEILMYISDQTLGKVKLNTISVGRALKMLSFARDKNYPEKNYGYFIFKKNV